MIPLRNKRVAVLGLGQSGQAATSLLSRRGAKVVAIDSADTPALRRAAAELRGPNVTVCLGATEAPEGRFDLVVVSPGVPGENAALAAFEKKDVPIVGELELGFQHSLCLSIAITGTNGKTTTTEMIGRLLTERRIQTVTAGNIGRPICSVADEARDLDFLTLEVSSFQLERIHFFRPVIGVLMNITADHLDRYRGLADYAKAKARLFANQQAFDWAVIQSEALAQLRELGVRIPSKIITFSSQNRRADLWLDRGLILSRVEGWTGQLLNMDECRLRGPHNAENLMAVLAVGRILRIPLEIMVHTLKDYQAPAHRCECVGEVGGVQYVNDSKATNLDAVRRALESIPKAPGGEPNVWLLAGGRHKGSEYHDVGPLLSQRVKGAYLFGEARDKIRAAWSLFTPCTAVDSLLEATHKASQNAVAGDVVLLSPACSSFDQFRDYQDRGDVFREAVGEMSGTERKRPRGKRPSRVPNPAA